MARMHLFEWEDQPWLPAAWRRYLTDYLQFVIEHDTYDPLPELLCRMAEEADDRRLYDLCSGSGGPWPAVLDDPPPQLEQLEVTLTDLYPNRDAYQRAQKRTDRQVQGHPEPVDATDVPEQFDGPRTVINGFHHFPPSMARAILADAVDRGVPIGVFEVMHRKMLPLVTVLLPLLVWLNTPRLRPLTPGRLLWTYLLPVVPFLVWWDGIVSCLRVYSPDELRELVSDFDGYDWEIGTENTVTYLIGTPSS